MGGDLELSRADRPATDKELALLGTFGTRGQRDRHQCRRQGGPARLSSTLPSAARLPIARARRQPNCCQRKAIHVSRRARWRLGALVDPPDARPARYRGSATPSNIGGTPFQVPGAPAARCRTRRCAVSGSGRVAVITKDAFATGGPNVASARGLAPGSATRCVLAGATPKRPGQASRRPSAEPSWTVRSAREVWGRWCATMICSCASWSSSALASLLIGGVSVWTGMTAYVAETGQRIAILRSMGAGRGGVFLHFFTQVATLGGHRRGPRASRRRRRGLLRCRWSASAVGISLAGSLASPAVARCRRRRPADRLCLRLSAITASAGHSAR